MLTKIKKLKHLKSNILFKNSIYLIISNGMLSLGGFAFWIFVARLYTTEQIGIATSLIAIINLVSSLALLGFNTGILRFLPISENKNALINSALLLVAATSLLFGSFVLIQIGIFSPPLSFVKINPYYFVFFILFTLFSSLNLLLDSILTALRSAKYVLIKSTIQAGVKLFLPFLFLSLGAFGIFSSFYVGGVVAFLIGGALLYKTHNIVYGVRINASEIKKIAALSVGTYISGLMATAPLYVLPILITNILGPKQTAFYYIVVTTTNVLNLIPQVIAQNLIVEGSYSTAYIQTHLKKTITLSLALLLPCVLLMVLFGNLILLVFGKQYSTEGFLLLRLLSICSIFIGLNSILSVILIVFREIKLLIAINTFYTLSLIGLSYYFIHLGIVGIGYATIVSQLFLLFLYFVVLIKTKKLFLFKSLWGNERAERK